MNRSLFGVQVDSPKWSFHRLFNLRYHPAIMLPFVLEYFPIRRSSRVAETVANVGEQAKALAVQEESETTMLKTLGWISAGLGAVAIGLLVGRELRQRYKFNRRTPYDFYAHSGDEQDMEFGVGI